MRRSLLLVALLFAVPTHAVTFDWVTVGDPGNPADTEVMGDGTTGYGSVGYVYRISKHEVTNAQYAEFLNAVAKTDTYALYDSYMGLDYGGITRSGVSGAYTYSTISGREDLPVNYVSLPAAMRFANWLHNGQPSGAQDETTTEYGAYWFFYHWSTPKWRRVGATFFVPSEDEWYKAAYYDAASGTYLDYPTGTDMLITCAAPGATPNTANCNSVVGDLTEVGSYSGSGSPNGTFDQGGNVWEWTETIVDVSFRALRGSAYYARPYELAARNRWYHDPQHESFYIGFRVASAPEFHSRSATTASTTTSTAWSITPSIRAARTLPT